MLERQVISAEAPYSPPCSNTKSGPLPASKK